MPHAANSITAGIVSRARSWWQEHHSASRDIDALSTMSEADLGDLARDCGVTPQQLLGLVHRGPNAAAEMHVLMQAFNIDEAAARQAHPSLLREMEVTCSLCAAKAQCRHDLAAISPETGCPTYCGNSDALGELCAAAGADQHGKSSASP